MALILPYLEEVASSDGSYITEDGEFIVTEGMHADYTKRNFLGDSVFTNYFKANNSNPECIPRFVVQIHNWDKLRTIGEKVIESQSECPNIRFHNWILMGFNIIPIEGLIYDYQKKMFVPRACDHCLSTLNDEYGKRIERIKEKVLLPERPNYFLKRLI